MKRWFWNVYSTGKNKKYKIDFDPLIDGSEESFWQYIFWDHFYEEFPEKTSPFYLFSDFIYLFSYSNIDDQTDKEFLAYLDIWKKDLFRADSKKNWKNYLEFNYQKKVFGDAYIIYDFDAQLIKTFDNYQNMKKFIKLMKKVGFNFEEIK